MKDWYGDNDPSAAEWLRELVRAKAIPQGKVDERDINELRADDLTGYRRVHLFAGIAGWAHALDLAGWPAARPVWTGSCPCQPFSPAGKRQGKKDPRHLWPVFFRLIRECKPATIFGEQTSGDDGYHWLAGVRHDLETEGYAVGCADLPACSAGSPIIRQRLWWVASAPSPRSTAPAAKDKESSRRRSKLRRAGGAVLGWLPGANGSVVRRVAPAWNEPGDCQNDVILCADGKYRRTQSGLYPLADGVSGVVAFMRGYGNSVSPACAANFIRAFLEAEAETEVA